MLKKKLSKSKSSSHKPKALAINNTTSQRHFLYKIFLIAGPVLLFLSSFLKINQNVNLSFTKKLPVTLDISNKDKPSQIEVPKFKVNLPIFQTSIENGVWKIDPQGVSFLPLGQNIILYSHNTKTRFGFLKFLKQGDLILLKYESGGVLDYQVQEILVVRPDEIEKLFSDDKDIIILYTCTGFADTKRLIVKAKKLVI